MKGNEKGQVLVLVALAIFALLGLAALGIDVGYMYSVRHELQRSADAGALAGASAIREFGRDCNDTTLNPDGRTTKAEAELRAIDYATRDDVATSRLNTVAGDIVTATCPDPVTNNPMRVRVDVQRTAPLFFARVLGRNNAAIPAFAVAEAFQISTKAECIVPWGIPIPWTENTDTPETYDPGDHINWPPNEDDCKGKNVTNWSMDNHTIIGDRSDRDRFLCQGSLQVLKIGDPSGQLNPGNFLAMDLSSMVGPGDCPGKKDNPGASFYYWMITNSCDCDIKLDVGQEIPLDTKTGNMVQNTITAVAEESYYNGYLPNGWKNDPYSLMNRDPGAYWNSDLGVNAPSTGLGSGRIVRIPVYDPQDFSGKTTLQIKRFVGFFIEDVKYLKEPGGPSLGTVVGRFVTVGGMGKGSGDESEDGSKVLDIRLVE
ncbi:hypothetical protein K0B90_09115 [bacterium]|nr:hypothetical protein [bacterium]